MGRKKVEWTDHDCNQFKELCSMFCTQDEICRVMDVDPKTLKKLINTHLLEDVTGQHTRQISFQEAFDYYSADGKMSLRRKQFKLAEEGDRTMLIFLGKCYLGQSDKPASEDSSKSKKKEKDQFAQSAAAPSFAMFKNRSPVKPASQKKAVGM